MSSLHNDEKSNRLARVRENQRRSRARKQQYIEELEQKVAACNAKAQQADIDHRISLQKLELENTNLRALLNRAGFDSAYVETYLGQCSNPATSAKVAIPALKKSSSCQQSPSPSATLPSAINTPEQCLPSPSSTGGSDNSCTSKSKCGSGCAPRSNSNIMPIIPTVPSEPSIPSAVTVEAPEMTAAVNTQAVRLPPIASICDCGPRSAEYWPDDENSLNTTVCHIAEDMISRYNIQGVDINLIKQRLWSGFRNSRDGCRVQNNVLFEVLDELSGNIP
ncbi:hypothetical protein BGW36DRAFT_362370 [Talaromyces proteolyticus]|uniref:BZIP domain-containing protein n=1 Tax=Talaromyces proteolyticus TaxID=1131652 RepID=A0AAD4PWU8_9EURO|nr:uncharacterized protein BGW36DRAFT_362370 [Talaromyces proteolyticus]KAH8692822.1 hypothetical protein BGW36DRAFT_362370 [Talaromyces proteolyticus]